MTAGFQGNSGKRVNLSASLISWQKSGENYNQWTFHIGISHSFNSCAEYKSVSLPPTAPPWTWPFLAHLSILHTMFQREPLLGPHLLCLEKMIAYSKIHKNFQWKFSKWNTLKDKNTLYIISYSMTHETGANYIYGVAEVMFTPPLRSTFSYTMSLKWSFYHVFIMAIALVLKLYSAWKFNKFIKILLKIFKVIVRRNLWSSFPE